MLHKLNGQINALLADFRPVENGGKGDFTAAATPPISPKVDRGVFLKSYLRLNLIIEAEKMSGFLALLLLLALIARVDLFQRV
jgi:hypothetical protein